MPEELGRELGPLDEVHCPYPGGQQRLFAEKKQRSSAATKAIDVKKTAAGVRACVHACVCACVRQPG